MKIVHKPDICTLQIKGETKEERKWIKNNPLIIGKAIGECKDPEAYHMTSTKKNIGRVLKYVETEFKKYKKVNDRELKKNMSKTKGVKKKKEIIDKKKEKE